MNLAIKTNEFDPHNIIISDKTKNNVMTESDFYRLIWSNEYCSTNGIFIYFNLKNVRIEKYFNKIKCVFPQLGQIFVVSFSLISSLFPLLLFIFGLLIQAICA